MVRLAFYEWREMGSVPPQGDTHFCEHHHDGLKLSNKIKNKLQTFKESLEYYDLKWNLNLNMNLYLYWNHLYKI